MNATVKLVAFAIALSLILGGGLALGAAVGPIDSDAPPTQMEH